MRLRAPHYDILGIYGVGVGTHPYDIIERAGRTCYKTEHKISDKSAPKFVHNIVKSGHLSVIEHSAMTVVFVVDRGVTHELVRHRLCAFSQESTRYVNYKGGCEFVIPPWIPIKPGDYNSVDDCPLEHGTPAASWFYDMLEAEERYTNLVSEGKWKPEMARSILPNSTKTEIVVTANFREWRWIFNLRCSSKAHPQMREVMIPLRNYMIAEFPEIFGPVHHDPPQISTFPKEFAAVPNLPSEEDPYP
jgi:thymidylate synthase (FAD)